jgi:type II secretory pathway pseudopilin PulG
VAFTKQHPPGALERRAFEDRTRSVLAHAIVGDRWARQHTRQRDGGCLSEAGLTLVELLFTLSLMATVSAVSMPLVGQSIDEIRTATAARYLAARITAARTAAVRSNQSMGLRFETFGGDYRFATFADGNGNGIRAADIRDGTDLCVDAFERLSDKFPGVRFALTEGIVDADGQTDTGIDGVRIGSARILTMSSDGTATSGTLYVRGRRAQYAVRVLGVTGRTRMMEYRSGDARWINR